MVNFNDFDTEEYSSDNVIKVGDTIIHDNLGKGIVIEKGYGRSETIRVHLYKRNINVLLIWAIAKHHITKI